MKISKERLKQLIKEEYKNLQKEGFKDFFQSGQQKDEDEAEEIWQKSLDVIGDIGVIVETMLEVYGKNRHRLNEPYHRVTVKYLKIIDQMVELYVDGYDVPKLEDGKFVGGKRS